jgi:MFS family permease
MDATHALRESEPDALEKETIRRVSLRLMPILVAGYFCAYLDRANVGIAAPTMNAHLGFSGAIFGFGAGIFFLGYFLAEIPSNLFLDKIGARRWIARILLTWGLVSGLTAFVWNDWSFYTIRFLLGLAEAGFFPGVVLYMTWWYPSRYRARMIAVFQSAGTISLIVGPPLGGLLLQMNQILGLYGWQWLFLLEALPSVIMAVVTWRLLTDRPRDAEWLRPDQRTWLDNRLAAERRQKESIRKFSLAEAFTHPKVVLLTLVVVGQQTGGYALLFFMPLIVKGLGVSSGMIGVVSALPYLCAFVAMIAWGYHSDRTGERTWHVAIAFLTTAIGMAASILIGTSHPAVTMVALVITVIGNQCVPAVFWSLPTALLTGTAAAGGIAMISAVGSLGGWFGPWAFGLIKDMSGSDQTALLCLAAAPLISAILVVLVGHDRRMERSGV